MTFEKLKEEAETSVQGALSMVVEAEVHARGMPLPEVRQLTDLLYRARLAIRLIEQREDR